MKTNQTILLGIVAALGVLAAVLWGTKPSAPVAKVEKPAPVAKDDPAPVAPPAPATPTEPVYGRVVNPTGLPINPTQTGELPQYREARAFNGIIDSQEQLEKFLDTVVGVSGGESVQKPLLSSTWRVVLSTRRRTVFIELKADPNGSIVARDETTNNEWYLVDGECRARVAGVVAPCVTSQAEMMSVMWLGVLTSTPYRIKQWKMPLEGVQDSADIVRLQPRRTADDPGPILAFRRDDGSLSLGVWGGVSIKSRPGLGEGMERMPSLWSFTAKRSEVGKDEKKAKGSAQMDWEGLVRVQEVTARKDKAAIKLPELTPLDKVRMGDQPEFKLQPVLSGAHPAERTADDAVHGKLTAESLLDLTVVELLQPADQVAAIGAKTTLGFVNPQYKLLANIGDKPEEITLPATPKMALKLVTSNFSEVPDQMVKFVGELKSAGHTLGEGRTAARFVMSDVGHFVELQVPLAK